MMDSYRVNTPRSFYSLVIENNMVDVNKNDMQFLEEWDVIEPSDYDPDELILHSDSHTAIVHGNKRNKPGYNMETPVTNVSIYDFSFVKGLIAKNCEEFRKKQAASAITQSANTREYEKKKVKTKCGSSSAEIIEIDSHIKSEQNTAKPETATTASSTDIDEYFGDREETSTDIFIPPTLTIDSSIEKSCCTSSKESVRPEINCSISPDPEEFYDIPENYESSYYSPKNNSIDDKDQSALTWVDFLHEFFLPCFKSNLNRSNFKWRLYLSLCLTLCMFYVGLPKEENITLPMPKMMNELQNDYNLLKEQILSEMKNDKLVSSVAHQIRELKKENFKLKLALYRIVKKIEKQEETQEKLLKEHETIHNPYTQINDWSLIHMFLMFYVCTLCVCIYYY